jgi:hypothetical protein
VVLVQGMVPSLPGVLDSERRKVRRSVMWLDYMPGSVGCRGDVYECR